MFNKVIPAARRRARRLALQALYQWQLSGSAVDEIKIQFHQFVDMKKVDVDYFHEVLQNITANVTDVDSTFVPYLDRPLNELNPIELAILRIAAYELTQRPDVPYRVIINEALELCKSYGATDGHKYVNGVLDKLAHQVRNTAEDK